MGKKIGVGAAAIVSEGVWEANGERKTVALKQLLLPPQQITSDLLRDFLVEIKLTAALYHEQVVRLIGVSCSPDLDLYIVTELMERGSIRDVLDSKGANLRWDIRLKLLSDAAKGMAYLHSRNVIHRDLKPRNLLVNQRWVCKVADFGASTIQAQTNKTMTVIGTPAYMAPEVLAHTKYSEKADVYSFGVIIVEVYTGEAPYTGPEFADIRNQVQLISRIVNDHLHPDTSSLPPALAALVYDCWEEEPALRPSFAEIIIRLRRLRKLDLHTPFSDSENDDSEREESSEDERAQSEPNIAHDPLFELGPTPILEGDRDFLHLTAPESSLLHPEGDDETAASKRKGKKKRSRAISSVNRDYAPSPLTDSLLSPHNVDAQILTLDTHEESTLEKEASEVSQPSLASSLNVARDKSRKKRRRTMDDNPSTTSERTPLLPSGLGAHSIKAEDYKIN